MIDYLLGRGMFLVRIAAYASMKPSFSSLNTEHAVYLAVVYVISPAQCQFIRKESREDSVLSL